MIIYLVFGLLLCGGVTGYYLPYFVEGFRASRKAPQESRGVWITVIEANGFIACRRMWITPNDKFTVTDARGEVFRVLVVGDNEVLLLMVREYASLKQKEKA